MGSRRPGAETSRDTPAFVLHLPNTLSAVEAARSGLNAYLAPFALDELVINRIEVILEELVSNIVRHGHEARQVVIEAECADHTLHLSVEDDGAAYNPLDRAEPAPFTTLDEATLGGLGLPLIRRLTDSVRYERVDGANRVSTVIATR